ncbi:hypothetical protein L6R49_29300 [Myxococcota bacterium]|nr:hypothetical protein [Myxococcota bacterium]
MSFIETPIAEIERVANHEAEEQAVHDACIILAGALRVFGVSFVCSTLKAEGVDIRVLVTDSPHFVEAVDLLREIKPDQALVDLLRAHSKRRAVRGGGAG